MVNIKKNKGFYRNLLFYGLLGIGKIMFVKVRKDDFEDKMFVITLVMMTLID